ncbi:hypothetical protein HDU98_004226, partial [Podochytrium sp. JEL0797]
NSEFDGQDLTPRELELKKIEIELNRGIDEQIMANPDKMPRAVWFVSIYPKLVAFLSHHLVFNQIL